MLTLIVSGFSYGCFAQSKAKIKVDEHNSYPAKQSAAHFVKRQTGGRVLEVKQQSSSDGELWRVKFLKDGKIQYMDVAPQSASD